MRSRKQLCDALDYAHRRGFVLRERPIVFPERTRGQSKMSPAIAAEALALVWRLRFAKHPEGARRS